MHTHCTILEQRLGRLKEYVIEAFAMKNQE